MEWDPSPSCRWRPGACSPALIGRSGTDTNGCHAAGSAGNTCSGYTYIDSARTLYFQTCTWTSWSPPNFRIWFTVHFGNTRDSAFTIDSVSIGYHINGSTRRSCVNQYQIVVPAHGVKASTDECWFSRLEAAVQSSAIVHEGSYVTSPALLSPTLNVRGVG